MKIIGIDIGTTSICGIVFDTEKQTIISSKTLPNNSFIKTENSYEKIQNPDMIMNTVHEILDGFYADDISKPFHPAGKHLCYRWFGGVLDESSCR